ncbi:MAG: pitrilysin family protein [Rikenellaceae bacterium]
MSQQYILDRQQMPPTQLPESLTLPSHTLYTTDNGVELYALSSGDNPVIRLSVVFRSGSRHQIHPFTASATLNMLSEGTARLTSAEISQTLDFYGIFYDTSIDRDFSIVTINVLEKFLPEALDLLEQLLIYPSFSEKELDIYKSKRSEQLKVEREKPAYLARELFSKTLFGENHPYGLISDVSSYETLTTSHIKDYFATHFTAQNSFAVCSGKLSDESISSIKELLSKLPLQSKPKIDNPVPPVKNSPRAHIEREDALQTSIRIGLPLFTKGDPRYEQMQVVAMVLGGYFGSRLVRNLREEHGYTYGIYAAMVSMQHVGYFAIATDVTAQYTGDAIEQIFYEIERLHTELISHEELTVVKNMIVGEVMRIIDGPFGIADVVIDNIESSMDPAYLDQFLQTVREITPQTIKELATEHLRRENLTLVTIGSEK